jgi:hypothetical protein
VRSPIEKTAAGAVYLRADLTAREHGDARSAEAAFEELLAGADANIGLSYEAVARGPERGFFGGWLYLDLEGPRQIRHQLRRLQVGPTACVLCNHHR